jgi:hypothetical protein
MFAIVIQKDRAAPAGPVPTDQEKLRLYNSMLAYAGTYTLDDEKLVHHIDASWNQAWTGTDQVRFYNLDGDVLTITGAPAKDPHTGQEVVHRIKLRRLEAFTDHSEVTVGRRIVTCTSIIALRQVIRIAFAPSPVNL